MRPETASAIVAEHMSRWEKTAKNFPHATQDKWIDKLIAVNCDDGMAVATYLAFCEQRRPDARVPLLSDVLSYFKKQRRLNPRSSGHHRPSDEQCTYCGDTGYMTIAAPRGLTGSRLAPLMDGFNPPEPFAKSYVYSVGVPCVCSMGQRVEQKERLSEAFKELRSRWKRVFDADGNCVAVINRYLMDCDKAHKAAYVTRERKEIVEDVPDSQIPF